MSAYNAHNGAADAAAAAAVGDSDLNAAPAMPLPLTAPSGLDAALATQHSQAEDGTDKEDENIVYLLRQSWINEKASPELLRYEEDIMVAIKDAIDDRENTLREITADKRNNFRCHMLQMELDRIKYMTHAYHRCRLQKLERYCAYVRSSGLMHTHCSSLERSFVDKYFHLVSNHFRHSFLDALPSRLRSWIEESTAPEDELVERPETENTFVAFRVKETIGEYAIGDDDVIDLRANDLMIGNWKEFKPLFSDGKIELM